MTLKGDAKFKGNLTRGLKNDTRNLVNFHARSRQSENLHFDGLLLSKAYKVRWKSARELCLMTLKNDAKFEEKLTLGSKYDMRNLVKFNASSGKSGNLYFDVLLLSKVYYVWAKKSTEKSCVITLKNDAKFEGELTCALLNDMRNFVNFDSTLKILKICTIMGSFWAKYIMFELKKYRRVMCHETEGWCSV